MHERSFDGAWWIPNRQRQPVAGRLTFSAAVGVKLEIVGELLTELEIASGSVVPYVLGTIGSLHTGNEVTLLEVSLRSRKLQGRYAQQQFTASVALLGIHTQSRITTRCEVSYDQLGAWLRDTGFDVKYPDTEADSRFTVTYNPVPTARAETSHCAFALVTRPAHPVHGYRCVQLEEVVAIDVVPSLPIGFEELRRQYLWKLQNFLTFATDTPTSITRVRAWIETFDRPAEVLFKHPFASTEPADPVTMLFSYTQVASRLTDVFSNWFALYDDLGPALDQMFAALYGEYRLADTRFLAVAQALESYHRRRFPVSAGEQTAHDERIARITSTCSSDDASWLTETLQHEYEPALRVRINALFERVGRTFLRGMCGSKRKQDSVAHHIATYRNKLAHLTLTSKELDAVLIDLHDLSLQMLVVLKASLLLDLGFQPADLPGHFRYNDGYRIRARRRE